MAMRARGVTKPLRRSGRSRRQFDPKTAYDATAYMKSSPAGKPAVLEVQATAGAAEARSTILTSWISAMLGVLDNMKLRLNPKSWRAVKRSSSKAAAKRKAKSSSSSSKKTAATKPKAKPASK